MPTGTVQLSTAVRGTGIALYEAAKAASLEGIVAKRLASTYELGRRSQSWLKIKTSHEADLVIGGWTPGQGKRDGTLGSLLMGAYDVTQGGPTPPDEIGELRYVGSVGTGFDGRRSTTSPAGCKASHASSRPFSAESKKEIRRV